MRELRRAVVITVLGALSVLLTGCGGDGRSELAKATDKARRLVDRASGLMRDPVYKVGEAYAPFAEERGEADAEAVTPMPYGAANPKADAAIDEGIRLITEAMSAAKGGPDELSARVVLARLYALRAQRHAFDAVLRRQEAWRLSRAMHDAAVTMADHGKRVKTTDQLLEIENPALEAMAGKARTDTTAARDKIEQLKTQIEQLRMKKADLAERNEKLLGEARALRVRSELAPVLEGIELFDKAKAKEDQATDNSVEITEVEDSIQFLSSQVDTLQLDANAGTARASAAEEIAAARAKREEGIRTDRRGFLDKLTEVQKDVETFAGKTIETTEAVSAAEAEALNAFGKAQSEYATYMEMTEDAGAEPDPAVVALLGDLRMSRGHLRARAMALQDRLESTVTDVRNLWQQLPAQATPPDVLTQVTGYVDDPGRLTEQMKEDYRWAAKNYASARELVPEKLRWVYDLQLAAAYAGLYRVSGETSVRQKGTDALAALGDAEASPYVAAHAEHLRTLLSGRPGRATTAPAIP